MPVHDRVYVPYRLYILETVTGESSSGRTQLVAQDTEQHMLGRDRPVATTFRLGARPLYDALLSFGERESNFIWSSATRQPQLRLKLSANHVEGDRTML